VPVVDLRDSQRPDAEAHEDEMLDPVERHEAENLGRIHRANPKASTKRTIVGGRGGDDPRPKRAGTIIGVGSPTSDPPPPFPPGRSRHTDVKRTVAGMGGDVPRAVEIARSRAKRRPDQGGTILGIGSEPPLVQTPAAAAVPPMRAPAVPAVTHTGGSRTLVGHAASDGAVVIPVEPPPPAAPPPLQPAATPVAAPVARQAPPLVQAPSTAAAYAPAVDPRASARPAPFAGAAPPHGAAPSHGAAAHAAPSAPEPSNPAYAGHGGQSAAQSFVHDVSAQYDDDLVVPRRSSTGLRVVLWLLFIVLAVVAGWLVVSRYVLG
jgi:hypothetical protein